MLPKSDGSPQFTGGSDEDNPGGLVFDAVGNLYATTYFGGNANGGVTG